MKRAAWVTLALVAGCGGPRAVSRTATVATPDQPFRYVAPALGALDVQGARGPASMRAATLPNGLRVLVAELPEATTVSMHFVNRGGDDTERDRPGLAALTARLAAWSLGRCEASSPVGCANGPDWYAVDHRAARFFGTVEPGAVGTFVLRLAAGLRRFEVSRQDFARVVAHATDERRNAVNRQGRLGEIVAPRVFDDGTLYNSLVSGTSEELRSLRLERANALFRERYTPSECALVAVGRTSLGEVMAYAERLLGPWQGGAAPPPSAPHATIREGGDRVFLLETTTRPQASVLFVVPVRAAGPRELASMRLLATTLGASFSSRIQRALRVERGSAYTASAAVQEFGDVALLTVESAIENGRVAESLRLIDEAVGSAAREGVTDEEFRSARRLAAVQWQSALDTPAGVAASLVDGVIARREPEDAPPAWIAALDALTRAEVNRYLSAELSVERARVFVSGDASALRDDLESLGFGRVVTIPQE